MTKMTLLTSGLLAFVYVAGAQIEGELALNENTTVTVASGAVRCIDYVSGVNPVVLAKEGEGTLEIAVVGNTNATFWVKGGKLKFVRPGSSDFRKGILRFMLMPATAIRI
jgi:hypothetical protein